MPRGTRRAKTATHAECCKCARMLPHDAFNKGQATCRECQNARRRDRYSQGRMCATCSSVPISNYAPRDNCRGCAVSLRRAETTPWRGVTPNRYVETVRHGHPNARARGRIYEHILVMSEKIGRPLLPGENVHHINGVRDDNRPENLELWVTAQPKGQRPADLVAWAHEILERYES